MTQAFNLSQFANKVNTSGQADLTTAVSGTLPVANGGTNNGSLAVTAGGVLYTDGSKVVNVGAGTSGQVLLSQGASSPAWGVLSANGALNNIQYFNSSGTYTATAGTSYVIVEVIGGGGTSTTGTIAPTTAGATNSFGAFVSATGGATGSFGTSTGGVGVGGDLNIQGQSGRGVGSATAPITGVGGCSFYGVVGSANHAAVSSSIGNTNVYAGAGGGYARLKITSGFSGTSVTVGAAVTGARAGLVIVYEYK